MCTLRASGPELALDEFLATSALQPHSVFTRGDPRRPNSQPDGPVHESSGANFAVSDAPWSDLAAQVADAEAFLQSHRHDLQKLAACPGLVDLTLDFPSELRADGDPIVMQTDRFPPALVRLAAEFGMAIELSTYN